MSQFSDIPTYFHRGTRLVLSKPLRPWVTIPLVFNIVLFGLLYWLAAHYIHVGIALLFSFQLTGFWSFLAPVIPYIEGTLLVLAWLLLMVMFASGFSMAVQVVSAPFMGLLAEKVNHETCSVKLPDESMLAMIKRTVLRETVKFWYWLWRAVLLLIVVIIFYFIPGLNLVGSIIWFLFSGWMLAMVYIDYGADCRLVPIKVMRRRLQQKRWLVLGFGCIMLALTTLPLINLVIMPVGVATGTLIWNERLAGDTPTSSDNGKTPS